MACIRPIQKGFACVVILLFLPSTYAKKRRIYFISQVTGVVNELMRYVSRAYLSIYQSRNKKHPTSPGMSTIWDTPLCLLDIIYCSQLAYQTRMVNQALQNHALLLQALCDTVKQQCYSILTVRI